MDELSDKVSVVIVNWNSGLLLSKCLKCLDKQTVKPKEIVIFDNNSTDSSILECSPDKTSNVRIVKNDKNIGFAAANNKVIREIVCTDYVALLNADAFPEPTWLEALVKHALANPNCASLSSVQLSFENKDVIDGIGDIYHFTGMVGRRGYHSSIDFYDKYMKNNNIFSACAGAALYSRDAFLKAGCFDEDFFCFVEDVDLGFRLQLHGYDCAVVSEAIVYHVGGASSGGHHSDISLYYGHRNIEWAFFKNMPLFLLLIFFPAHVALIFFECIYFLNKGKINTILKSKLDAFKGLSRVLKKRRQVHHNRNISIFSLLKKMNYFSLH
jgi:GT2 family glycosyltransferase